MIVVIKMSKQVPYFILYIMSYRITLGIFYGLEWRVINIFDCIIINDIHVGSESMLNRQNEKKILFLMATLVLL